MKTLPSLRKMFEADETQFGTEISKINDWFSKKYDKSFSFNWDGSELIVKDADDKETEKISKEDLSKEIPELSKPINEAKEKIEAYGVKGNNSKPWRKTFNSAKELEEWLNKNNAEVQGTCKINESAINLESPAIKVPAKKIIKEINEASKSMTDAEIVYLLNWLKNKIDAGTKASDLKL
jgi:hypothetical protein